MSRGVRKAPVTGPPVLVTTVRPPGPLGRLNKSMGGVWFRCPVPWKFFFEVCPVCVRGTDSVVAPESGPP